MSSSFRAPKGVSEYVPPRADLFYAIREAFAEQARLAGYGYLELAVFEDTNIAKQQLMTGQVDAILADLPTAFYITAVEIPKASIIGQFQPETGDQEEFGMLFEKGSPLVECVNQALAALREDGTLDSIQQQWLSDAVGVTELTP